MSPSTTLSAAHQATHPAPLPVPPGLPPIPETPPTSATPTKQSTRPTPTSSPKKTFSRTPPHASARLLAHPLDRNTRRRNERKRDKGLLVEPIRGYFGAAETWNNLSERNQDIAQIYGMSATHPHWTIISLSAAAIYGAVSTLPHKEDLYKFIQIGTDSHTSTGKRQTLPLRFHYIRESRPEVSLLELATQGIMLFEEEDPAQAYIPINDTVGMFNGVLISSPLQTIFDCLRMLPFEDAIIMCDQIADMFDISYQDILQFGLLRRKCWKNEIAGFKAKFVDRKSENGGESFCRARMARAGLETPELQTVVDNPLRQLNRPHLPTLQNTRTIRPDFAWELHEKDSAFTHIAGELDGNKKYIDPKIHREMGVSSINDVISREKDRETALNLVGYKVVRFSFAEALYENGRVMIEKLIMAGVRLVKYWERMRRKRFLARFLGDKTLHRLF